MEIRKLQTKELNDFKTLIGIFKVVFENDDVIPDDSHLQNLLSNPDFMVFVVRKDGEVRGGLTAYVLHQYYSHKPQAYIYDVGVLPEFQRQGLGKRLIAEVCAYFRKHDFDQVYVEAESEDIHAVRFYRQTAFSHEMEARHFTLDFSNE